MAESIESLKVLVDKMDPSLSSISEVTAYQIKLLEQILIELQELNSK